MPKKKPIKKVIQKAIADETYLPKPKVLPNKPGVDSGFRAPYEPEQYVNYPFNQYKTLPEVVVHSKTKNKYKNLPNITVTSKKKSPTIKQAVESSAIQMHNPFIGSTMSTANPGQTKRQIKQSTNNIKGNSLEESLEDITAMTQFFPHPFIAIPSMIINSGLGLMAGDEARRRDDELNQNINQLGAAPWKHMLPGWPGKVIEGVGAAADLTDNFGLEQKKNGGWLDEFEKGGKTTSPTTTKFVFPTYTPERLMGDNTKVNVATTQTKTKTKPVPVSLNPRVAKQNEIIKNAKKEKNNYAIIDKAADSMFYFKPTGENITGEPIITGASQNDIDYGLSMKDWFKKTGSSNHEDYFKYLQSNNFQTTPAGIFHIGAVRENVATNPDFYGGMFNHWFRPEREKQIYDSRIRDYGPEQKLLTLVSENGVPSSKAIHGTGNPDRISAFNTTGANRAMSNGCVNVNGKTVCFDQLGKGSGVFVLPQESQDVLNYNDNVTARNKNKLYAQTRKDVANAFVERGLPISKDAVDFVSAIAEKESKNMRSLGAKAEAMFPYFSGGVGAFQIHPDLFKQYLPSDYEVGDFNTGTEAVYNFYNQNKDKSAENMYKKYSGDKKGKYTPVFNRTYNRMKKTYEDGGYVGEDGYTDQGFNYNSAWGGQFAIGGSLPGSVGFTYARTNSPAPSNGPYAKKTLPSAQNGQEMSFYQHGLDWKPKSISKNGSETGPGDPPKKPFTLPPIDLPTSGDSTFLRQKALEQQAWFKKHPEYQKSGSMLTKTYVKDQPGKSLHKVLVDSATNVPINKKVAIKKVDSDIADVKKALTSPNLSSSQKLILQESLKALNTSKSKLASEASGYKKQLDKNRFEQRELTTEIINPNVPMGTYDTRIEPQRITVYDNIDSKDPYYDDVVEIPEYDPIALTPRAELTEKELKYRIKNYGTKEDKEFYNAKFVTPKTEKVIERSTFQPKKIEIAKPSMPTKLKTLDVKGVDVPNLNQKSEYAFTWSPDGKKQQTNYYPNYDLWKEAVDKANTGKPGYNAGMVETTESGDKSSGQALLRGTPQFKRGGWLDDL